MAANQVTVATPGPSGVPGLTYEGLWVVGSVYQVRDCVRYTDGNLYVVNTQHTSASGNNPVVNTSYWSLFINANDGFQWATLAKHSLIGDSLGNTGYSALHQSAKAQDWARLITDAVTDDPGTSDVGYSAKAWAIGGTEVTTTASRGAAKEWATKTNAAVDTSEFSSKAYAIGGTGITTSSGKGAAKEWATTTGGYVDTAEYSAKEYAIGTTVAVGSAKDWAVLAEDSAVTGSSYSALHHATKAAADLATVTAHLATFQSLFHGASTSTPSSNVSAGDLWFDTNTGVDVMKAYNSTSSTWEQLSPSSASQTNINAAVADAVDIGLVAGQISPTNNISTIGTAITNVNIVGDDLSNEFSHIDDHCLIADAVTSGSGTSNITAVAGKATEIGRLGTAAAVADMAILGTSDIVTDMAILATSDIVADMAILGTAAIVTDMAILGTADVVIVCQIPYRSETSFIINET